MSPLAFLVARVCLLVASAPPPDQIHESDRILRAKSHLGVLCTPADAPTLSPAAIGRLFDNATLRLNRGAQHEDPEEIARASRRLLDSCMQMQNPAAQEAARAAYRAKGFEVVHAMRIPIDIAALERYAQQPEAAEVPTRKRVANNTRSYRQMIADFLPHVTRCAHGGPFGFVEVHTEYKRCGRALVDAGIISAAREYAIAQHAAHDPFFALSRELRGIAMGFMHDVDDNAAHPHVKNALNGPGLASTRQYLAARNVILAEQAGRLFPHLTPAEGRGRVKQLYNMLNNDGRFTDWKQKWGVQAAPSDLSMHLADGSHFNFESYLEDLCGRKSRPPSASRRGPTQADQQRAKGRRVRRQGRHPAP